MASFERPRPLHRRPSAPHCSRESRAAPQFMSQRRDVGRAGPNKYRKGAVAQLFPQSSDEMPTLSFTDTGGALTWRSGPEVVRIEGWGDNSLRVRAGLGGIVEGHGALMEPAADKTVVLTDGGTASITVGSLTAVVDAAGYIRFVSTDDGAELLAEKPIHFWWPGPRNFTATGNGYQQIEQSFAAYEGELLFGLGQHAHGRLNQKGIVLDLVQRNSEVSIPFMVSSRGYGFLWNNPAVGRVEIGGTATRWVANSARQIDYWVTAGSPAEIAARYADVTGHAPVLPEWAAGFWQSKLRYRTQDELLESCARVPPQKTAAIRNRRRFFPLDAAWRLALRAERMARPSGHGGRAGRDGRTSGRVGVAVGERAVGQLPAHAESGLFHKQ